MIFWKYNKKVCIKLKVYYILYKSKYIYLDYVYNDT